MKPVNLDELDGFGEHRFTHDECVAAGKKGHELGRSHEWTSDEARKAGIKGREKRMKNLQALREKVNRQLLGYPEEEMYGEKKEEELVLDKVMRSWL